MSERESWWRAVSCSCMILRLFRPVVVTPFVVRKGGALRCGCVERPCCLFCALESRSAEVRERYRGSMDPNVEGSLLYSHALSLVRSTFVTSFVLDAGRERGGNALAFSLRTRRCAGLTSTAADLRMSERERCAWMFDLDGCPLLLHDPPSLRAGGCNTVCRANRWSVKMRGWSGLAVLFLH